MKNVQLLDCTLRDGGRIINCKYEDKIIKEIAKGLTEANIDIIEMGFLRDENLVQYEKNSTFFTSMSQIRPLIPKNKKNSIYTVFIDYDMFDFLKLGKCDDEFITGIRVGFTKKQFENKLEEITNTLKKIKLQGYKLFVQSVNILAYTDRELLDLIEIVNDIQPYSFGIVDTYGGMYLEDITHIYNLVDYNLDSNVCVDIHSHNNFQLSFAFAQEIISLKNEDRKIILDATLNGMGKCAGNLNTELIVDYLYRKKNSDYDIDIILDIIDRYLYPIKHHHNWGYSIPAFMAGIYKVHPNNVIYLTEKYRLNSKDIKYIISAIDEEKRQKYDYDNIKKIYKEYFSSRIDDTQAILRLKGRFYAEEVLVIAPGRSVVTYKDKIIDFIKIHKPIVVCVNFAGDKFSPDFLFYANTIHWEKISDEIEKEKCILTSNIHTSIEGTNLVNYTDLICEDSIMYDNSTMMLLNLLKKLETRSILLAGFDGLKDNSPNYIDESFPYSHEGLSYKEINEEIARVLKQYKDKVIGKIEIGFLTPSIYER